MFAFRHLIIYSLWFIFFCGILHSQEGFQDWSLSGYSRIEFKGKPVAKLIVSKKEEAYLFETEGNPIVLTKRSFAHRTRDTLEDLELPASESRVVYEAAWQQLRSDRLSPWWEHLVDGAAEAFHTLHSEKENGYVAILGGELLKLKDEERMRNAPRLEIQTRTAQALLSIGKITKAKAIVSKMPESKVPLSIREGLLDLDDQTFHLAEAAYKRFSEGGSDIPLIYLREGIRLNIEIGQAERLAEISDLWLTKSVESFQPDPSGQPKVSLEVKANQVERIRRNMGSRLPQNVAYWWICQSGKKSAHEKWSRWEVIRSKLLRKDRNDDYFDLQLAKELAKLGLHKDSEPIFARLAKRESKLTGSLQTKAQFEVGKIAERRGDWKEADRLYLSCTKRIAPESALAIDCYERRLLLSLEYRSTTDTKNIVSEFLSKQLSGKLKFGDRIQHPFVLAARLRKLNPDWEVSWEIIDGSVAQRLLEISSFFPKDTFREGELDSTIFLASALAEYGEIEEAKRLAKWAFTAMGNRLQPRLHHIDEAVRLEASREIGQLYRLFWKVGMEDELRYLLYQYKGGVLDGVLTEIEIASRWPSGKELLNELRSQQMKLIDLELSSEEGERDGQIRMTEKKISHLSRKLNFGVAEIRGDKGATKVAGSHEQMRLRLPNETVLVDYFLAPSPGNLKSSGAVYLAVVSGKSIRNKIVEIGGPDRMDHHIRLLQESGTRIIPEGEVRVALQELHTLLLEPILRLAPNASKLILSPDGLINNVPFVALLNEKGEFVGQNLEIRMQRTPSSLGKSRHYAGRDIAIYCRPNYQADVSTASSGLTRAVSAKTRNGFRNFDLTDLPGTETEALKVQAILAKSGWDVALQKGDEARESALTKTSSPRILHLATHGFYLPPATDTNSALNSFLPSSDNEMLRVGLFLAGSQQTLNAWNQPDGKSPPSLDDGIVFAAELSQMRFPNTELVVLSACETGLGDVQSGEGVMGFSRALETAGVPKTLLTLWPVDDRATVDFMSGFYQKLSEGKSYGESLQATQMEELLKFRSKEGIATAIRLAAPFQMLSADSSALK